MRMNIPDPPRTRLFSPNKKFWVDIIELGEVAMGAEKREYITSFAIDGVNSLTFINAKCGFIDDLRFLLGDSDTLILCFMVDRECMHLAREEFSADCSWIDIDFTNLEDPTLIFRKDDHSEERRRLSESLGLFKPGRALVSNYRLP